MYVSSPCLALYGLQGPVITLNDTNKRNQLFTKNLIKTNFNSLNLQFVTMGKFPGVPVLIDSTGDVCWYLCLIRKKGKNIFHDTKYNCILGEVTTCVHGPKLQRQ